MIGHTVIGAPTAPELRAWEQIIEPSLRTMYVSLRAWSVLCALGVRSVDELCAVPRERLMQVRNCGRGTADDIEAALAKVGRRLADRHVLAAAAARDIVRAACPDCNPAAFRARLVAAYGEPVTMNGVELYADPELRENQMLDPAQWARALCPLHAPRAAK